MKRVILLCEFLRINDFSVKSDKRIVKKLQQHN